MAFPTRRPLKQVRRPLGTPPETLLKKGGVPLFPPCFRAEKEARPQELVGRFLPPTILMCVNPRSLSGQSFFWNSTVPRCPNLFDVSVGKDVSSSRFWPRVVDLR